MQRRLTYGVALVVLAAAFLGLRTQATTEAGAGAKHMLSHDVYFTLNDNSPAARQQLVAACKKYLSKHPGEVFFAAGPRVDDLKREVNDQAFDVALHIVFGDKAAHDKYQDAPRHLQFIAENKGSWKNVRVFDSVVE